MLPIGSNFLPLPIGNKEMVLFDLMAYMTPYGCMMKHRPDTSAIERALRTARSIQDAHDLAGGSPIHRAAEDAVRRSKELERLTGGVDYARPEALRSIEERVRRALDAPGVDIARQVDRGLAQQAQQAIEAARAVDAAKLGSPIARAVEALSRGYTDTALPAPASVVLQGEPRVGANRPRGMVPPEAARGPIEVQSTADLGQLVRSRRISMGLSQQAFADLSGVGRRFISELEAGKPTAEFGRVLKVCRAAGIQLTAA